MEGDLSRQRDLPALSDDERRALAAGGESLNLQDTANEVDTIDPNTAWTEGDMESTGVGAPNHGVRGLLYYIAKENAARRAYIHRGIRCEGCGEFPIRGIRYHCLNCPNYDLCATCEANAIHQKNHIFAKIKIPLSLLSQPPKPLKLWYAGDPQKIHPELDMAVKKQLCRDSGFDEAELDALYDQFTCIANVPWNRDSSHVAAAIDRHAFNRTMSSDRWPNRSAPNVLLDRTFAFYDTDGNSLIGFREFVDGMEYLRGSNRFASLQRALQGFDMDGDGYVSREDFMRILRAKFDIQRQLIFDATEGLEMQRTQGAMDILRSSQPISSVFNGEDIPLGEVRRPRGKVATKHGDMEPVQGDRTVLDDDDNFIATDRRAGHERLRETLNRFEDFLIGREQTDGTTSVDVDADLTDAFGTTGSEHPSEYDNDEPYRQYLLWYYKERGIHQLLDSLFTFDTMEEKANATRDARKRWRVAIDQVREDSQISMEGISAPAMHGQPTARPFVSNIVPTDHETLEQRELETMHASLEDLLDASGYSIQTEALESAHERSNSTPQTDTTHSLNRGLSSHSVRPSPLREMSSIYDDEEAMPQSVASSSKSQEPSTKPGESPEKDDEVPPAPEVLRLWAVLDVVDREMNERGGPGRLSLAEVEQIVVEQNLGEVRGLIKSWLEWAAL